MLKNQEVAMEGYWLAEVDGSDCVSIGSVMGPSFLICPPLLNVYLLIYFGRECEWGKGRERQGQRIWSRLCADSREPDAGLKVMNCEIITWAEVRHSSNWATQAPLSDPFCIEEVGICKVYFQNYTALRFQRRRQRNKERRRDKINVQDQMAFLGNFTKHLKEK